jgi:hypothetical protein
MQEGILPTVILIALPALNAGCGLSVGPMTHTPVSYRASTVLGPEVGYRAYWLRSQGLFAGGTAAYLPRQADGCCHEVHSRLDFGYGVLPLAHESRLGFEAALSPTAGNVGVGDRSSFAYGAGVSLSLPFRVTHTRQLWEQGTLAEPLGLVVPRIGLELLRPTKCAIDHRAVMAFETSVTFRYHEWPTSLP